MKEIGDYGKLVKCLLWMNSKKDGLTVQLREKENLSS